MVVILDRSKQREIENEEKSKWILSVLQRLGIPTEDWKITGADQMMPILRKIRNDLQKFDLQILDNSNCGIDIYFKDSLIAAWKKPTYILKENKKEKDSRFRYYLEMHTDIVENFK